MFRRHWLTLLITSVLAYFGLAVAPVMAGLVEPSQIIASN